MNDTVAPAMVHTPLAELSIVKLTGSPEVAVAVTIYGAPPTTALVGTVEVNVIVCGVRPPALLTANDCCTCGAGAKVASPPWLASIVHVPAPIKLTTSLLIVHTVSDVASIVSTTARPD